jgi:hypothetical protein
MPAFFSFFLRADFLFTFSPTICILRTYLVVFGLGFLGRFEGVLLTNCFYCVFLFLMGKMHEIIGNKIRPLNSIVFWGMI